MTIIYVIALVLVSCVTLVLCQRIRRASASPKKDVESQTQELVGLCGYAGKGALTRDGSCVVFLKVEGKNHAFMTEQERDLDADALSVSLASIARPYKIHRIMCPVDTQAQVLCLEKESGDLFEKSRVLVEGMEGLAPARAKKISTKVDAFEARRRLIEEVFLPEARECAGKVRAFTFVTCVVPQGPAQLAEAARAENVIASSLASAGYRAEIMAPSEIERALTNYFGRFPCEGGVERTIR